MFEPDPKINFYLYKEYGISNEKEMIEFYQYLDNITLGVFGDIDFGYNSKSDCDGNCEECNHYEGCDDVEENENEDYF
jgi:hypothetical protein